MNSYTRTRTRTRIDARPHSFEVLFGGYVRLPRAAAEIDARNRRRVALGVGLGVGVLNLQLLCERRLSRDGGQL